VEVEERRPGLWRLAFSPGVAGRLVVAESWDPGWHARLDGRPAAVERADGLLLGVDVAAGDSRLELSYRPAGLLVGAALSLLALALLLLVPRRRRNR
jgi:uncharacterized membrane protein YfhO